MDSIVEVFSKSELLEDKRKAVIRDLEYKENRKKENRRNQVLGLHDYLRRKLWYGEEGEWIYAHCKRRGGSELGPYDDIPDDVVAEVCKEWEKAGWIVEIKLPKFKRFFGGFIGRTCCLIRMTSLPTEVVPVDEQHNLDIGGNNGNNSRNP